MESCEMPKIISFSGRKESGKSALADICVQYGYERVSFAIPLKNLICELQDYENIDVLNNHKNISLEKPMNDDMLIQLSEITEIPIEFCKEHIKSLNNSSTGRDWLQVIGTDLIRKYDENWHVRHTLSLLDKEKKYVFDDVRFPNELDALRKLKSVNWFVIRPKTDNVSNHISERALNMNFFHSHIIINDNNLDYIQGRMKEYLNNHIDFMQKRNLYMSISYPSDKEKEEMKKYFLQGYTPDCTGKLVKIIPNETKDGILIIKEVKEPMGVEMLKTYLE
jgi:hypothetical protein